MATTVVEVGPSVASEVEGEVSGDVDVCGTTVGVDCVAGRTSSAGTFQTSGDGVGVGVSFGVTRLWRFFGSLKKNLGD